MDSNKSNYDYRLNCKAISNHTVEWRIFLKNSYVKVGS